MFRSVLLGLFILAAIQCTRTDAGQASGSGTPATVPAGEKSALFYDDFSSGDMSATNKDGFHWGRNNRTSIVTVDEKGPLVVWNNKAVQVRPSDKRNWKAHKGKYCLRFRYPAGQPMAEQRFDLGKAYPEIWMSFRLRVPDNFYGGSKTGRNCKIFRIWMDDYGDIASKAGMEFRRMGNDGGARFYMKAGRPFGDTGSASFVKVPQDRGKWMQLVIHLKANSSPGSKDSVFEVWRRWDGQKKFTKTHSKNDYNIEIPKKGPHGFRYGYLMGWANDGYKETTEWLLDEFTVSTHSLLDSK